MWPASKVHDLFYTGTEPQVNIQYAPPRGLLGGGGTLRFFVEAGFQVAGRERIAESPPLGACSRTRVPP